MKLETLRVRNFRCYGEEISVSFEEITALIGRNDAGKSSLMDALDIFLNDGAPDSDDAKKNGDASDLTITCEFSDIPDEVVIDDSYPTSLQKEGLINEMGRLEIHKKYSGHLQKPKCESIAAYAVHPTAEPVADLLQCCRASKTDHPCALKIDQGRTLTFGASAGWECNARA